MLDAALAKATASAVTPDVAGKLAQSQDAWVVYRDAEVELDAHLLAAKGSADAIRGAVLAKLLADRMVDLRR